MHISSHVNTSRMNGAERYVGVLDIGPEKMEKLIIVL